MYKVLKKYKETDSQYLDQSENYVVKFKPSSAKEKSWEKWSIEENIQYLKFMENNKNFFSDEFTRRSSRVFLKLSKILDRRSPDQCRTHHQKMQTKCKGNMEMIIGQMRQKIVSTLEKRVARNDKNAQDILQNFLDHQKMERQITKTLITQSKQKGDQFDGFSLYFMEGNSFQVVIDLEKTQMW